MKKLLLCIPGLLCFFIYSVACTTFLIHKNGKLAFGRNYDWITDVGMVCTNLRGLSKTSLPWTEKTTISWVSKYGSITFNQYGKEFPTGGMNEKGLVVEMMWMDGAKYPSPDQRAALGVLQWIQYQLDNCATIEDVIATDANVRLTPIGNPPVHYLVADPGGNAATIEFLNGKMIVHKGSDLPLAVLTNTDYASSAKARKDALAGNAAAGFNDNSLQRFSTACSMVENYYANGAKQELVDYSFEILDKVSNPDFTKWSIVYDISNRRVYFASKSKPRLKWIDYGDVDFSCGTSMAMDMNDEVNGNALAHLKPFTNSLNTEILQRAAIASKDQIPITEANIKRDVEYAAGIKCK